MSAMPATPQPIQKAEKPKPKKSASRPDFSTLGGIVVALTGILGGLILEKGSVQDVAQATAAMIVLGGTLGAVMVTTPLPVMLRAFRGLGAVFWETGSSTGDTIEQLIHY